MICPACSRRWDSLTTPGCPICAGAGLLTLGPLTRRYPPAAIAIAVAYALELCATRDMRARKDDYTAWLLLARHNLTVTVNRCTKAGLLAKPAPVTEDAPPALIVTTTTPPDPPSFIAQLAVAASGLDDAPGVAHRLAAPPVKYTLVAVPVNGAHPGFSNGGSIANFAIIADPIRQLDNTGPPRREQLRVGELLGKGMFPDQERD